MAMRSEPHELRILIADRPGPARSALAGTLSAVEDVVVVGAEGCARELGATLRALRPDVVVIDDRLLGEWNEPYDPRVRVIVVGVDDDPADAVLLEEIRRSLTRTRTRVPPALHGGPGSAP
jgi:DNA-binding NarL/FixJ family response regulator